MGYKHFEFNFCLLCQRRRKAGE